MSFQKRTVHIAGVIIVVFLIVYTYITYNHSKEVQWPPVTAGCPDWWEMDPSKNGLCNNPRKFGKCFNPVDFNDSKYQGSQGKCNKRLWADNCGVQWDGITNTNYNICN